MPVEVTARRNSDPWLGLLLAVAALLCNALILLNPPAVRAIPWISIAIGLISLFFLARGVVHALAWPQSKWGKALTALVTVLSLFPLGMVAFVSVHARSLPASAGAPKIGDRAPDFTLSDTSGRALSLGDLYAPAADGSRPKAVLLIFYRGYW